MIEVTFIMSERIEEEKIKAFTQALTLALARLSSEPAPIETKMRKLQKSKKAKRRKKKGTPPAA